MSSFTSLGRIIRSGILNFKRNGLLSTATVIVLSLNLLILGGILIFSVATDALFTSLEEKIDISVYFKPDVAEVDIRALEQNLTTKPEIKSIEYVSKEVALERFRERHKDDEVILNSLDELGINPLESSLNIKARNPEDYPAILEYFRAEEVRDMVDQINDYENEQIIERLSSIVNDARRGRLILSLILSLVSILITFITIKLAINNAKEEIAIMRLVGSTNWHIRGPFLIEGIIYGLISSVIAMGVLFLAIQYGFTNFLFGSSLFESTELNLPAFFIQNGLFLFLALAGIGIVLSLISSIIAIRKYLNV